MFVFDCRSGLHSMVFKSKRYGMQDSPRWRRFVDLAGHQGASFASGHRHFCALNKHTEPSICLVEGIIPCPQLTRCLRFTTAPGWASLGGGLTSDPAATLNAPGGLVVFARGSDNAIWTRWQTTPNGNWS
jgi:hypothetical protein